MQFSITSTILRPEHCDPLYLLKTLGAGRAYCALLESCDRQGNNNFSFLSLGQRDVITVQSGKLTGSSYVPDADVRDPLVPFETLLQERGGDTRLTMGYIGFLSFEAARLFDTIHLTPDPNVPDALFVLPEVLLKIDHESHEVTLITHVDTQEDLDSIREIILSSPFYDDAREKYDKVTPLSIPLTQQEIAPFRQTSEKQYCDAISEIKKDILAGEVFQVVLSQELRIPKTVDALDAYESLRALNPSPYMFYYRTPSMTIVGASPETLVRVEGDSILYRPIAGTRKRTGNEQVDTAMRQELLSDEKERCEHQMLVDLGRNDIGRVATIGSVEVRDAFRIEQYAHVYHLVSDIIGTLDPARTSLDVLRAVFPAGTLTGAPKIRAMEVIHRLENSPRGIYGGAFGYIDLSGNIDLAITIRTMVFGADAISIRVGAGIVNDSVPEHEDAECLHKARSCLGAIKLAERSHHLS